MRPSNHRSPARDVQRVFQRLAGSRLECLLHQTQMRIRNGGGQDVVKAPALHLYRPLDTADPHARSGFRRYRPSPLTTNTRSGSALRMAARRFSLRSRSAVRAMTRSSSSFAYARRAHGAAPGASRRRACWQSPVRFRWTAARRYARRRSHVQHADQIPSANSGTWIVDESGWPPACRSGERRAEAARLPTRPAWSSSRTPNVSIGMTAHQPPAPRRGNFAHGPRGDDLPVPRGISKHRRRWPGGMESAPEGDGLSPRAICCGDRVPRMSRWMS